jgi:hypothetical protein
MVKTMSSRFTYHLNNFRLQYVDYKGRERIVYLVSTREGEAWLK